MRRGKEFIHQEDGGGTGGGKADDQINGVRDSGCHPVGAKLVFARRGLHEGEDKLRPYRKARWGQPLAVRRRR